jgi:hypothetical protein
MIALEAIISSSGTSIDGCNKRSGMPFAIIRGCSSPKGVVMTLLGVTAVIWPQISSFAVEVYVG